MTKRTLQIAANALILLALVLIVSGLGSARPLVWGAGLLAVACAMTLSFATRWIGSGSN